MAAAGVSAPRRRPMPARSSLLAIAVVAVAMAWSIRFSLPGAIVLVAAYGLPGLVLALRRPGQPIAWLLLLLAVAFAMGPTVTTASLDALQTGEMDAIGQVTAWAGTSGWVLFFAGFLGIQLTFPAGTFAAGRWRTVSFALIAVYVVAGGLVVFGPTIGADVPGQAVTILVPNPFVLPFLVDADEAIVGPQNLFPLLLFGQVGALLVMLARFRRSTGLERLQYRWLGSAAAVVVLGTVAWQLVTLGLQTEFPLLPGIVLGLTWPWFPIAVVVAVLRYRLYEIDRLVSRSVGWALASASIVGVFAAGVLAFSALLGGLAQSQALATAAATLLAFALFQPVRTRLQRLVDRRFDRPRIEAERTLELHGERLARVVELDVIERDVIETVAATVRPATMSVWIRPRVTATSTRRL